MEDNKKREADKGVANEVGAVSSNGSTPHAPTSDVGGGAAETIPPAVGWHSDLNASPEMIASSSGGQPTSIRRSVHRVTPPDPDAAPRDMAWSEVAVQQGVHPGDRYIKHLRPSRLFNPDGADNQRASEDTIKPRGPFSRFTRILFGKPLATSEAAHERLTKVKALAILSSDALSSVAYATEEIVKTLAVAGVAVITGVSIPIALAIATLLLIVAFSYRQTIFAYPKGGGSYIVSKENLGVNFGLVAGAALMTDYILTVAVSVSAGTAAIVSAFPGAANSKVVMALGFVLVITVVNLRGIKESGAVFSAPTYLFILTVTLMIVVGVVQTVSGWGFFTEDASKYPALASQPEQITGFAFVFLVMRAFASGCSALTGVEAISDGVPAFHKPEAKNAATTLIVMVGILGFMFLGITFLSQAFHVVGVTAQGQTVIDQVARHTFTGFLGPVYPVFVVATTLVLVLAANTCYSDFPRVAFFLARDKFLPNQFSFRGDRLAYNTGIIVLAVLAALLLVVFKAETGALIPLYAIGVFLSFTLSQSGMVSKWLREKNPGWQRGALINGIGAVTTTIVLLVVAVTKFNSEEGSVMFTIGDFKIHEGAWIVMILIPLMVAMFRAIHRHYERVASALSVSNLALNDLSLQPQDIKHVAIVPISSINIASLRTIGYARSIFSKVIAIHATDDLEGAERLKEKWSKYFSEGDVRLVILETPYRSLVRPLISFVEDMHQRYPDRAVTVILPEFVAEHWWENILHTHTALRLKGSLLVHPDVVVTSVPYHIGKQFNILGREDEPVAPLASEQAKKES